ncbi:MAG TPA: cytochrome P450 [Tepidiformaceae bacterium]|nr:cytochrome P450 [Tepidiformaceae bacterium]
MTAVATRGEELTLGTIDITDTDLYVQRGYPWREWDLLRREAPVYWYERPGFEPFWAITKYADIQFISKRPEVFSNRQRLRLAHPQPVDWDNWKRDRDTSRYVPATDEPPDLVFMDPPQHRQYRSIVSSRFTPRAMTMLETHLGEMTQSYVGGFARRLVERLETGEETDFVHECAARLPVAAICEMADVPREDWDRVFRWTEVLVGSQDPEYQLPGETARQASRRNINEWFDYMERLMAERRTKGLEGHDLLSMLLRAEIDGQRLTEREVMSYIILLLAAGNETTRNSTSGGLHALLEHPSEAAKLVERPELLNSAVEEVLRWTSVVIQFTRTAMQDVEIRGQVVRKGQTVAMWYPSANRDEDVFAEPYRFDITRDPNDHFAFGGYGEHFCLGSNLARWEMRAMFRELIPLLPRLEVTRQPERLAGQLHVGGIKRLMVRSRP